MRSSWWTRAATRARSDGPSVASPGVIAPPDLDAADDALVEASRGGDVRALETLLLRHESKVLRVLRLLGVPQRDREDVAQEVFLRVFRHLDGFKPGHPFAGWLYRVTVNAAHDYRGHAVRLASEEAPWGEEAERAPHGGRAPDLAAEDLDLRRRLETALGALSERERAVFVLREMEGLETLEIARALGITRITVRRHLSLAKARLRRSLST